MASGLYNPRNLHSVKSYLQALTPDQGLPPRRMMYDEPNLAFESGVESRVFAMDSIREKENGIGRNYTHPAIPAGHCYVNKERRPDPVKIPGLD